jgi:hypothetical protein
MNNNKIDMTQLMQAAMQQQQLQQQNNKNITWLSYWETLSIVLLILNALGYISIGYVFVFMPIFIPIIVYMIILLFGFIKTKFFN